MAETKPVDNGSGPAGRLLGCLYAPPADRASFATHSVESRGRYYREEESLIRTCYQRDRDRILHSTAFRRLKHKTQVFVQHEGDYYRTRMTHSLEVAQIARTAARVLALDEDLAEAVALAHDLGHTPFGHAGEEALSAASALIGGFDHNAHALRLVTKLEHRYSSFDGLNLTWETLEGLVKHNGPLSPPVSSPISSFDSRWSLELSTWPGLEAQVAALSDDIAYVSHDIDDGLRAQLFSPADLEDAPLVGPMVRKILTGQRGLELSRFIGELVRTLIGMLVDDLLDQTRSKLKGGPESAAGIRTRGRPTAGFSAGMERSLHALKEFLFARMYRHARVMTPMNKAKQLVSELFSSFSDDPSLLPPDWAARCGGSGDAVTAGVVRDYIAGMTDSYALHEYERIFHTRLHL
ncbi:MAG: deoxyguanosinetriphosphate triphosphohydrolase [Alphaproteobacteria bacterium]|nr:deoxyguanosinetriphosphate triphosphohydrolase [Alphaproteobacteria bacterium]